MDSDDDSRPGSSASNSSSSSNSADEAPPIHKSQSKSPASGSSSSSSNEDDSGPRSPINGQSRSPSPIIGADDRKSIRSLSPDEENNRSRSESKDSIRSASSDGSALRKNNLVRHNRSVSRNQSISPVRKSLSKSSRASSVSSVSDDENIKSSEGENESDSEPEDVKKVEAGPANEIKRTPDALNMSHEDLSDVSDLGSPTSDHDNEDEMKEQNKDEEEDEEEDDEQSKAEVNDRDEEDGNVAKKTSITDLRQKLDERKNHLKSLDKNDIDKKHNGNDADLQKSPRSPSNAAAEIADDLEKKNDEDALDFEAEEGECNDTNEDKSETKEIEEKKESEGEVEDGDELEEGEVSDEDEKRPEETEPKPVCRFYTRGQCTWGMSCRFLHPGVTDKGNYTMFDMIRPVPVPHAGPYGGPPGYHDFRNDRPPIHHGPPIHHHAFGMHSHTARPPVVEPVVESAWERGLRTAKEMMRKANKRKEQDMDFEDKKMNLSASQDELEKDNYYIRDRASPEAGSPKFKPAHYDEAYSPPPKYPPRTLPPAFEEDPYGRSRYRELPPHRMPQYEDEVINKRRIRPAREVIVQRAEPRGDEWNDPWMRSKSPGRDKRSRRDRRSYSSNSSYSSSSSSHSGSSSNTSHSPSPHSRRRRYSSAQSGHKSPPTIPRRHVKRSPSPPKRRHSPAHAPANNEANFDPKKDFRNHPSNKKTSIVRRLSPAARKRNISPALSDKRVTRPSPPIKRKRPSPSVLRKAVRAPSADKVKKKRRASSSASGSSESSGSESESSYSSSSSSSSRTKRTAVKVSANAVTAAAARPREKTATERKIISKKVEMSKKRSPIQPAEVKTTPAVPTPSTTVAMNSKKTTRREELLKQLKAVEDAIARKRSKLT